MLSAQSRNRKINGNHPALPAFTFKTHSLGAKNPAKSTRDGRVTRENDINTTADKPRSSASRGSSSFLTRRGNEVLEQFIKSTEDSYSACSHSLKVSQNGVSTAEETSFEKSTAGSSSENGSAGSGRFVPTTKRSAEEMHLSSSSSPLLTLGPIDTSSPVNDNVNNTHKARYERLIHHKVLANPPCLKLSLPPEEDDSPQNLTSHDQQEQKLSRVQRSRSFATMRDVTHDLTCDNANAGLTSDNRLNSKLKDYGRRKKQGHTMTSSRTDGATNKGVNNANTGDSRPIIKPPVNESKGYNVCPQPTQALHNTARALGEGNHVNTGHRVITRHSEQDHRSHTEQNVQVKGKPVQNTTPRDLDVTDGIVNQPVESARRIDIRRLHRKQQAKAAVDHSIEVGERGETNTGDTSRNHNSKYQSNQDDLSSANRAVKSCSDSIELNTSVTANTRQLPINRPVTKTASKKPAEVRGKPIDSGGGHFQGKPLRWRGRGNNAGTVSDNCIGDNKQKNSVSVHEINPVGETPLNSHNAGRLVNGARVQPHKNKLVLDKVGGGSPRGYGHLKNLDGERSDDLHQIREGVSGGSGNSEKIKKGYYSPESLINGGGASSKASTTSGSEGGTPNSSASKLSDRLKRNITTPILPSKSEQFVAKPQFGSKSHETLHTLAKNRNTNPDSALNPLSDRTHRKSTLPSPLSNASLSRNVYLQASSCDNFSNFGKDDFKSALQRLKAGQKTGTPVGSFSKRMPANLNGLHQISETDPSDNDFSEDSDVEHELDPLSTIGYKPPGIYLNSANRKDTTSTVRSKATQGNVTSKNLHTTRPYLASNSQEKFKSSSLPNMRSDSHKLAMQTLPSYAKAVAHGQHNEYAQGKPVMKSASFDSITRMKRKQQLDANILTLQPAASPHGRSISNANSTDKGSDRVLQSSRLSGYHHQKPANSLHDDGINQERPKTGYRQRIGSDAPFVEEGMEFIPSETESVSLFSDTCSTVSEHSDSNVISHSRGYLESHLRTGRTLKEMTGVPRDRNDSAGLRPKSAKGTDRSFTNKNKKGNMEGRDDVSSKVSGGRRLSGDYAQFGKQQLSGTPGKLTSMDGLNIRHTINNSGKPNGATVGYLQKQQFESTEKRTAHHQHFGQFRDNESTSNRPKSSKGRHRLLESNLRTGTSSKDFADEFHKRGISSDSKETIHHTSPIDTSLGRKAIPSKKDSEFQLMTDSGYKFKRPDILKLDSPRNNNVMVSNVQNKYNKPQMELDMDSGNDTDVDGEIEILDLDKLDNMSTVDETSGSNQQKVSRRKRMESPPTGENTNSSKSAESETSSAWGNGVTSGDYHGNRNTTTGKQHMFHSRPPPDNVERPYDDFTVDTPRLTPKEFALMRERTQREINISCSNGRPKTNQADTPSSSSNPGGGGGDGKRVMQKSHQSSKMYGTSDVVDSNNSTQQRNAADASSVKQSVGRLQGMNAIYKEGSSGLFLGKQRHKKLPDVIRIHDNPNDLSTNTDLERTHVMNGGRSIKPKKLRPIEKMSAEQDSSKMNGMNYCTQESDLPPFHKTLTKGVNGNVNNSNSTSSASQAGILTKPRRARSKSRSKSDGFDGSRSVIRLENSSLGYGENDSLFDSCYSESPGELTDNSLSQDENIRGENAQFWSRRHSDY